MYNLFANNRLFRRFVYLALLTLLLPLSGFCRASVATYEFKPAMVSKWPKMENRTAIDTSKVPSLKFLDEKGDTVSLSSLKGKVVFINFWATWCPPCREELPFINQLQVAFKDSDDFVILMVEVEGHIKRAMALLNRRGYNLKVYKPLTPLPASFFTGELPTTIILNKKGVLVGRIKGAADYSHPEVIKGLKRMVADN